MWLVAKNSSLLSPDLTLIILHISLRNLRVLGSIGPRTSMHIGKNSIEGRAFPYFFIFSSAALAAAKPHSLLVSGVECVTVEHESEIRLNRFKGQMSPDELSSKLWIKVRKYNNKK
ncbi:hypothetical protein HELRODRAFT_173804 [Helobdella robusta]|uniref:Uncharacterized protein n=1 Tax=Helobdella robusta TaxID=6412 RepID=T1F789_HELRO|nr:hypothetical protein HELRODRAFT_173804 [Helobdella robusta]ESO03500.1 hypothetical protein HELRODRAFT_173804 [Helobdella robusta]